jgi:hypothetical protein
MNSSFHLDKSFPLSRSFLGRLSCIDAWLLAIVALTTLFYFWTAETSVPFTFAAHQTDVYNLLADGLLHGHTYLPIHTPAGLLALRNPYNPVANVLYRGAGLQDLSLYKGHIYAYWGAIPALTLFMPERLLPIGELPQSLAVAIYATLALVFAVLFMRLVVRRFLADAPAWAVVAGAAGLAFGSAIPFALRRPAQYEVALTAGACFLAAGLYLLACGVLRPVPRYRILAIGSLCLGFAFNARPPLLLGGGVLIVLVFVLAWRREELCVSRRRIAVVLLGPFAACLLLTGVYNYQRFGSPGQYGVKYQLAGVESSQYPTFQLSYLKPGIYNYVFSPPRLTLAFPYVFLPPPPSYPGQLPPKYVLLEPTGGVLPTVPIVLSLAALPWLWWRRRKGQRAILTIIGGLALLGVATLLGVAFTIFGTTQRYEVDFDIPLILAGVLAWLALLSGVRSAGRRRVAAVAGSVALAWGAACGVAVSFTGYYNLLQVNHPYMFAALQDITSPLATLPTMLLGRPVIASVVSHTPVVLPNVNYLSFGQGDASTSFGAGPITLNIISPHKEDIYLRVGLQPSPSATLRQGPTLTVSSPNHALVPVPVTVGVDYLPVHLHWGLNRVRVNLIGALPSGEMLNIEHMVLVNR